MKEVVEGPDPAIDRIIRSIRDNRGVISGKLVQEFPLLEDSHTAAEVVAAVRGAEAGTAQLEGGNG